MSPQQITTFAQTLAETVVTYAVPGTLMAVTFDTDSYAGKAVYLHEATQHPYVDGKAIGSLGAMVGHGNYATLGRVQPGGYVLHDDIVGWWTARRLRPEVAIEMALVHMGKGFPAEYQRGPASATTAELDAYETQG